MKKDRRTGMLRQMCTNLIVEGTIVVFAALVVVTMLLLMGQARGPTCYIQGCQKRGVHAVRVCEDHRR